MNLKMSGGATGYGRRHLIKRPGFEPKHQRDFYLAPQIEC